MARVYLSLGSNIDRHRHLCAGLDALAEEFGELMISPVYESEAVGFDGDNFFNLVVGLDTDLSVGALSEVSKKIENRNGRRRDCPQFSARTLDIDILTYNDTAAVVDNILLPRQEVLENAFVLLPLADIAPGGLHPVTRKSYAELWQQYDQSSQKLWAIDFSWQGRQLSSAD